MLPASARVSVSAVALGLFLLALLPRLAYPGAATFKRDEIHPVRAAQALVLQHHVPLQGSPGSHGIDHPPLTSYLYALPLLIGQPLDTIPVLAGTLDALGVLLLFLLVRTALGNSVAVGSAILMAVNPYAVTLGRKLWAQPQAWLAVLGLGLLVMSIHRTRALHAWLGTSFVMVGTQFHLAAALQAPAALFALWHHRSRTLFRHVVILLVGFGFAIPYALYLVNTPDALPAAIRFSGTASARVDFDVLVAVLDYLSGNRVWEGGGPPPEGLQAVASLVRHARWLVAAALLASAVGLLRAFRAGSPDPRAWVVVVAWAGIPVGYQLRHLVPIDAHHLQGAAPALFLLTGFGIVALARTRPPWTMAVMAALVGLLMVGQLWLGLALSARAWRDGPSAGYGLPIGWWSEFSGRVKSAVPPGEELYVYSLGAIPEYDFQPMASELYFGADYELRFLDRNLGTFVLLREDRPVYFLAVEPAPAHTRLLDGYGTLLAEGRQLRLYRLAPFRGGVALAVLDNGAELLAAQATVGERGEVNVRQMWRLRPSRASVDRGEYSISNHLLASGTSERIGQSDGVGLPSYAWRDGDVLIQTFRIEAGEPAPEADRVRVGMYSLTTGDRARVVSHLGPGGWDYLDLPLSPSP